MAVGRADCICRTCGNHFERVCKKRNREQAEKWAVWAESAFDECLECRNARLLQCAQSIECEHNLCDLIGTEKQVQWARRIRAENYADYEQQKKDRKWNIRQIELLDEMFEKENRSWFWIEHRDSSMNTRGTAYMKGE